MIDLLSYFHFVFDSRKVKTGSVFVALNTGVRHGINFAKDALKNGASFLILDQEPNFKIQQSQYIVVKNTLDFITQLAKKKFLQLKQKSVKTIAITGSAGKTTTKDLTKFLLQQAGKKVFATEGNLNNHIGLPLTILNAPVDIEFLILEMGMNNLNEISHLVNIAPADVRVITNIFPVHVGNFKNRIEGIFQAKTEILQNSTQNTTFITVPNLYNLAQARLAFYGNTITTPQLSNYKVQNNQTLFDAFNKTWHINKKVTQSWLSLILLSLQIMSFYDISVSSIENFDFSEGRGKIISLSKNCILIDESYNANPESIKNAIETLNLYEGKKCLILGEMKELGVYSQEEHRKLIDLTKSYKSITTFFIGEGFNEAKENWFVNIEDFLKNANFNYSKFNVILAKASNSMNFTQLIKQFLT